MNSAQQNAANSGLPVLEPDWLDPLIDLTAAGKTYLDQALNLAMPPCLNDHGDYSGFASATQLANSDLRIGAASTDGELISPATGTATADDSTGTDDEDRQRTFFAQAPLVWPFK